MGPLENDLERLYDESAQQLFVCALAITRCPALAEDAVHDAFRRLLSLKQRPEDLKVYALRSVRNAAIDIHRKGRRAAALTPTYVFDACDPRDQVGLMEFKNRVAAALLKLPDDERETIVQHLYGGLTFREIAEVRENSLNTVASWYRRGLEKLRRELEEP